MASALLTLAAATAAAAGSLVASSAGSHQLLLPAPVSLLVEHLGEGSSNGDVVVGTRRPRFSFLPHSEHDHPGNGVAMASYRIVVSSVGAGAASSASEVWNSGDVNATAAVGVKCGVELASLTSYTWTASWKAAGVGGRSPPASASFTIGPVAADWASEDAKWVGAGQNEFRITVTTPDAAAARIFVASPGGAVLRTGGGGGGGVHLGSDPIGVSAWVDFRKSVPYLGFPLVQQRQASDTSKEASEQVVTLTIGNGFWSGSYKLGTAFWGIPAGQAAVAQLIIMGGTISKIEGRRGAVIADDPWEGSVVDCRAAAEAKWGEAKQVPAAAGGWRPTGTPMALQVPYVRVSGRIAKRLPVKALEVTALSPGANGSKRWAYKFSRNIVGHAAVALDAVTTTEAGGNLTLRHCELLNTTLGKDQAFCLALAHLPDQPDTFMLPAGLAPNPAATADDSAVTTSASGQQQLTPSFTWHGFQYVVVEATAGVDFAGKLDSLEPHWTVPDLTETSAIRCDDRQLFPWDVLPTQRTSKSQSTQSCCAVLCACWVLLLCENQRSTEFCLSCL